MLDNVMDNKKKIELLIAKVLEMQYGDILSHNEIEELIGERYKHTRYYQIIASAKPKLLESAKDIEIVYGHGYRIVNPDNYNKTAMNHMERGAKKIKKGLTTLMYAPTELMSEESRTIHRNITDRVRIVHASLNNNCVELNLLSKKNHSLLPNNINK